MFWLKVKVKLKIKIHNISSNLFLRDGIEYNSK